ncbi:threonine/serine exporter family protein [Saccharibacillus sp. CPCC 101409]|uniref:threonine/serine exporter family protein n=1 Tax=Saccharibacillus sp. CPCC 101409 TaxID=3058041 RepID=UPI002673CD2A|nr:threonine/serine exporter family protein [Saccharibacillus sp. CPCC 101409]MDO3410786.1 threonine/serine exporter family protein [Saccharibacillus sp. CPCC 101409]
MDQKISIYETIELCLLAGKIMLQSGAETYRVEDTMVRIATAFGLAESHSYVTPTALIFSTSGEQPAKLIRIEERTTDLHKIAEVNAISRRIASGELSARDAKELLLKAESASFNYTLPVQILAAAVTSACFLIMFGGTWPDFLPALLAGGSGFAAVVYLHRIVQVKFFSEFSAALVVGLLDLLFVWLGFGREFDKIAIGSVMPLVPGLLITNAIRDLMAGHLVSGISKGADACLTAFAIGAGIAVAILFFH